jgi:hypothetical protein
LRGKIILKSDKPLIAAVLGVLATIPYEIFTRVLLSFKIGKYSVYQLSSLIITLNRPDIFLGIVICTIVGGSIAIVFYYLLKKIGSDYLVIKSSATSLLGWIIVEAIYTLLIEGPKLIQPRPINDYYMQLFGSLIFGITLGILFKKYLFNKFVK